MKKLLAVLFTVAMCVSLAAFAGCKKDNNEDTNKSVNIDVTKNWENNTDEDIYTISNPDGGLKLEYDKGGDWKFAKHTFLYESKSDLAKVKTLVMTGSMTTNTNDPKVTVKLEYNEGIAAKEQHFEMSSTSATYEWNLEGAQLDKASRLLIFAEGARVSAVGSITFTKMVLTSDAINPDNDISKQNPTPDPVEEKVSTITATAKTFNEGWYDGNGTGVVYTIEKNGTSYNVSYDKKSASYANMRAYVTGEAIATYKTARLTVKGTAGKQIIFKPFNAVEEKITMTGGEDVIIVDISKVTDVVYTEKLPMIVMIEPGAIDVTGTFTIINGEFSTEEKPAAPVTDKVSTITATDKTFNEGWYDGGDSVYTVTKEGTGYKVDYDKKANEYPSVKAYVTGEAIATYKTARLTVKGTKGDEIIFKPFNAVEEKITMTGNNDEIIVDITGVTGVDYSGKVAMIVMVRPGVKNVTGTFTIIGGEFSTEEKVPAPLPEKNEITATNKKVTSWVDSGDQKFTVTAGANGVVNVTKAANGSWSSMKAVLDGDALATVTTFKISLSGVKDKQIIVKPFNEGAVQYELNKSTVNAITLTINLAGATAEKRASDKVIYIFFEWDNAAESSFTINNAEFGDAAVTANTITKTNKKITTWVDNGAGAYTVTAGDNGEVNVVKAENHSWDTLKAVVTGADLGKATALKITLRGVQDKNLIVKGYDGFDAVEVKYENDGKTDTTPKENEITVTLNLSNISANVGASGLYNVLIFFNFNNDTAENFTIVNAEFEFAPDPAPAE